MTGPLLFGSGAQRRAAIELATKAGEIGIDHIPCAQAPELFFPDRHDSGNGNYAPGVLRLAVKACEGCPIKRDCGQYALEFAEEYGVWGGMTASERAKIRGKRFR